MNSFMEVKRLEDIAFVAVYHDVVGNLLLCPEHRQTVEYGGKAYGQTYLPFDLKEKDAFYPCCLDRDCDLSSEMVRGLIRARLSDNLVGTFSDEIRVRLVEEFRRCSHIVADYDDCKLYYNTLPSAWAFLDCVVDDLFTGFEVCEAISVRLTDWKLVEVLVKRAPHITSLSLACNFSVSSCLTTDESMARLFSSLSSLESLAGLSFRATCHREMQATYSILPLSHLNLKSLALKNMDMDNKSLMTLLFGEHLCHTLFNMDQIHLYRLPPETLPRYCSTLRTLQLKEVDETCDPWLNEHTITPSLLAFLLQHMSQIEQVIVANDTICQAIKILHEIKSTPGVLSSPSSDDGLSTISSFNGSLSLKSLCFVNVVDQDVLAAAKKLCPRLEKITFCRQTNIKHPLEPHQLKTLLTGSWPKLKRIAFYRVPFEYCRAVIDCIGCNLLEIKFISCLAINLTSLPIHRQLESLQIHGDCTLADDGVGGAARSEHQLTNLRTLESHVCLKKYAYLFKENRHLVNLSVPCFHLVDRADHWPRVVRLWPNIQKLSLGRCQYLTVDAIGRIFTKFSQLKELTFSNWIIDTQEELEASWMLQEQFRTEHRIQLVFYDCDFDESRYASSSYLDGCNCDFFSFRFL